MSFNITDANEVRFLFHGQFSWNVLD